MWLQQQEVATTAAGNSNSLTHTHTQLDSKACALSLPLSLSIYLFSAALLKLLKVSNRFLTEVAHVRTCFLPMFTAASAPAPAPTPAPEPLLSYSHLFTCSHSTHHTRRAVIKGCAWAWHIIIQAQQIRPTDCLILSPATLSTHATPRRRRPWAACARLLNENLSSRCR